MGFNYNIGDLTSNYRTGLRVEWAATGNNPRGIVLFWPEGQEGYPTQVIVIFDNQPHPIQVPATELVY